MNEKGEKFITEARKIKYDQQLIQENSNSESGYESQESQSEKSEEPNEEKSDDENLCIICCDEERSLVCSTYIDKKHNVDHTSVKIEEKIKTSELFSISNLLTMRVDPQMNIINNHILTT